MANKTRWAKKSAQYYVHNQSVIKPKPSMPKSRVALSLILIVGISLLCAYFVQHGVVRQASKLANALQSNLHLSFSPARAVVNADDTKKDVGALLQKTLQTQKVDDWGISIYDLGSDNSIASIHADDQMQSASLYKLYVAYGVSQRLPYDKWASTNVGGYTVATCVDLMLRTSSNECGLKLGDYVGWGNLDVMLKARGFKYTNLNRADNFLTSSSDTAFYMKELYYGRLFDKSATAFVMQSLSKQVYRQGIAAGCQSCVVINKTGDALGVVHDTAIVSSGQRTYVVSIMSSGSSASYSKVANVEREIEKILAN